MTAEKEEVVQTKSLREITGPLLQRQVEEEEEEIQAKSLSEDLVPLQMQVNNDEGGETISVKGLFGQSRDEGATIEQRISLLRGRGQPLPLSKLAFFEPWFGTDLSRVRVHTDARAEEMAKSINAKAFAVGTDIAFGSGQYAPETKEGKSLLAHELTHVVQQTGRKETGHIGTVDPLFTYSNSLAVQRKEEIGALDIARAVIDPRSLIGKLWLRLDQTTKAKWVDKTIDAALWLIEEFPGRVIVGGLWGFIKEGLKGFYGKLKSAAEAVKIRAVDKIAMIMAGRDEAFAWAYLKGTLKGFFIDGALGIFIAIWDLIKGMGKLWDFLRGIGDAIGRFPEEMERLLQGFVNIGRDLAANIEPAINELKKLIFDKQQASSFLAVIVQKAKTLAKEAGEKIAESLLKFFSKPGASAEIGETVGNITGQVLWEVVFAVLTAGGGAAVTGIKNAARVVGKLVGKVVAGILEIVEELRLAFGKVIEWVKGAIKFVKGKLSEVGSRFTKLLEDIWEFFGKLLRNCHESKINCKFPKSSEVVKAETKATRREREAVSRAGRGGRESFVSGGVRYKFLGNESAFAALRGAPSGAQVYVIRDSSGRVMYVGFVEQRTAGRTAIERLKEHLREKPGEFLGDASSLEVKGVGLEERIGRALEDDLITEHNPKWNRRERDPQRYRRKYRAEPMPEEVRKANNISVWFTIGFR
jgi:hypothetical protein